LEKDFKDFLIKKIDPRDNCAHPFCNACSLFILNKKCNISSHKNSNDPKEAMEKYAEKQQQERRMATFLNNPVENKVKALELRLALLVTQRNLAFSLPKEIIDILKKELPSNPFLNRVSMGKTKTANVIRDGITGQELYKSCS
jgi:hypothetical protein